MELKDILPFLDPEVLKRWTELQQNRDWDEVDWTQPKTFTDLANVVRNSGLGGDVREALAKMFEEVSVMVGSGANDKIAQQILEFINSIGQDLQNISIGQINPNLGKIDQTYLSDDLLKAIAGTAGIYATPENQSITTIKYVDNSITPNKASFLKKSSNLFDVSKELVGHALWSTTGEPTPNEQYSCSDFIEVKPNEPLTMRYIVRIVYFNADRQYITFDDKPANSTYTTTVPDNAYYMRVHYGNNGIGRSVQINRGSVLLPYEKFYNYIEEELLSENLISPENTTFINRTTNLLNTANSLYGVYLQSTTGDLINDTDYSTSEFIKGVWGNVDYTVKSIFRVMWYDVNKERIGFNDPVNAETVVTAPSNAKYMRVSYQNGLEKTAQVNEGDTLQPYEQYYTPSNDFKKLVKDIVDEIDIEPVVEDYYMKDIIFNPSDFTTEYNAPTSGLTDGVQDVAVLYSKYDSLVSSKPSYITKKLWGKDSSGVYDIYSYNFKPVDLFPTTNTKKIPKIIISGGMHGFETVAIDMLYEFVERLVTSTEPVFKYLRRNVQFVIMPLVNPWSYQNDTRVNANSVDINLNFDHNWEEYESLNVEDPLRSTYKGTAPFSEVESQYLKGLLDQNKDALFYIDWHNTAGYDTDASMLMWHIAPHKDIRMLARYHIGDLTQKWQIEYPSETQQELDYMGYVSTTNSPSHYNYAHHTCGLLSSVSELWETMPNISDRGLLLHFNLEFMVTWILYVVKYFKNKY